MAHIAGPDHEQGSHHWHLTLDRVGSHAGTCTPNPGESRYDMYLAIRAAVLKAEGWAADPPPTLFFDIQLNELGGAQ